jgi:predicted outer membrane repeat protein
VASLFLTITPFIVSADSSTTNNFYVAPTDGIINVASCQQNPMIQCLNFNQYLNNQEEYFHSNAIFIFLPGNHHLNSSLRLNGVQNISFHGELTSFVESVMVFLHLNVSLSWTNCDRIDIHSLSFISVGDFEYRLMFVDVQQVSLSNVSIIGNRSGDGCSAIASQSSVISITDSIFTGIRGQMGAILALNSSRVILNGINTVSNNAASLGGAIFSINSDIQMYGTVNVMNNTATLNLNKRVEGDIPVASYHDVEIGGAIFADSSNITINGCATFVNNSARVSGGALATVNNSTLIIDGSFCDRPETTDAKEHKVVFDRNKVTAATSEFNDIDVHNSYRGSGGAIYSENGKVIVSNAVFIDNYSPGSGGAVQFNYSDVSIQYVTMLNNSGFFAGAMRVIYSRIVAGGVNFFEHNRAREEYGGAILID